MMAKPVLKSLKSRSYRFVVVLLLLITLLTFNVGRVYRVEAVGTTVAIAGTAFILTGAVYLSYIALTQGEMILPAADELHDWLGDIGRKVSQFPSGAAAYKEIYEGLLREPVANVIDGVWTWTQDKLKSFVNDFADTSIIGNIVSYSHTTDAPRANFNFSSYTISVPQTVYTSNSTLPLSLFYETYTVTAPSGPRACLVGGTSVFPFYCNINTPVRNYYNNGNYYPQTFNGSDWVTIDRVDAIYRCYTPRGVVEGYLKPNTYQSWQFVDTLGVTFLTSAQCPVFLDADIYDASTQTLIPARTGSEVTESPQWNDPDNNNRPIIPWVPIPQLPANITPPSGYTGVPQWGFSLQDLLDTLESLSETLMGIGAIGELINQFAGLHGDDYYLYYDDGDTNYYTYYQPTIYDNDTDYVTYNIDLSEQEDIIPVNLNTIQEYTDNVYLDTIKSSSLAFGSAIAEYFIFWHNADPVLFYTLCGSFIVILIGAFIGKWGHS